MGANDAELVHGCVIRCNLRLDDFFGSFLEVVECVGVKIVVGPASNDETDVGCRIFVEAVTLFVLLVPTDGIKIRGIVRECGFSTALCDVEASLFRAKELGVRICEFIGAN